MRTFSGFQWLLIDAANNFGHDKMIFEDRIQWAEDHLCDLESLIVDAETKPLFIKAVMAIRKAQAGLPTGHLVEVDSTCSGVQIMSALTGCIAGATATGLVNPDVRADAYTDVTEAMNGLLGGSFDIPRSDAKRSVMTSMYGSRKVPLDLFGEDTPELGAFYQAVSTVAPGAWDLLQVLRASWQPNALVHEWKLPDGFDARVKVMDEREARIEIDELDHATFTYEFYENVGTEKGLSLIANCIHSVDGYLVRSMHRRCNYDREVMEYASEVLEMEVLDRMLNGAVQQAPVSTKVSYYTEQYERSGMPDAVILPYIDNENAVQLSTVHLKALSRIVNQMLEYKPFELVTIHDAFRSHANNVNHVRQQYINIMAELADSKLLSDLLSQIRGVDGTYTKLSENLSELIKSSNYALS